MLINSKPLPLEHEGGGSIEDIISILGISRRETLLKIWTGAVSPVTYFRALIKFPFRMGLEHNAQWQALQHNPPDGFEIEEGRRHWPKGKCVVSHSMKKEELIARAGDVFMFPKHMAPSPQHLVTTVADPDSLVGSAKRKGTFFDDTYDEDDDNLSRPTSYH
jgi:hypothetical protein